MDTYLYISLSSFLSLYECLCYTFKRVYMSEIEVTLFGARARKKYWTLRTYIAVKALRTRIRIYKRLSISYRVYIGNVVRLIRIVTLYSRVHWVMAFLTLLLRPRILFAQQPLLRTFLFLFFTLIPQQLAFHWRKSLIKVIPRTYPTWTTFRFDGPDRQADFLKFPKLIFLSFRLAILFSTSQTSDPRLCKFLWLTIQNIKH